MTNIKNVESYDDYCKIAHIVLNDLKVSKRNMNYEDFLQEILLHIYKKSQKKNFDTNFSHVYTIMKNKLIDLFRSSHYRRNFSVVSSDELKNKECLSLSHSEKRFNYFEI